MSQRKQSRRESKMKRVDSIDDLVNTANSYLVRNIDHPRWKLTLTHFDSGVYKIRVSAFVRDKKQYIDIVNVNANRLDNLISLLVKVRKALDEHGVKTAEEVEL